jgi:methylmalonyl-CoA mutase
MVQQIAYSIAHVNEYFNRIHINQPIVIQVVGAKIISLKLQNYSALRLLLFNSQRIQPRLRMPSGFSYKTKQNLYDYNVNMHYYDGICRKAI